MTSPSARGLRVLVTGGTGFVGSHTCVALIEAGYEVVILDNLCNSDARVAARIGDVAGSTPRLVVGDVRDRELLARLFAAERFDAVVHFAGLKAVSESVAQPLAYYDTNVGGTLAVLQAAQLCGVRGLVFSSSATVYGEPDTSPIPESAPLRPYNPYGRSKRMAEELLVDAHAAQAAQGRPTLGVAVLRYFNPAGAHPSGRMGEHPRGTPNNLMPYVSQVATGARPQLTVHGGDYPTPDGTGQRDYVHVMDLAEGHVAALRHVLAAPVLDIFNLGTGEPVSVLQVIHAFAKAAGREIPHTLGPRRAGDLAAYWGDPARAAAVLGWRARRTLADICADSWRWQSAHPDGY